MPNFRVARDTQSGDGDHGRFVYNNLINCILINNPSANTLNYGMFIAQTLCEANQIAAAISLFADGDLTTIKNLVEHSNTAVGERCSRMYNDTVGTRVAPNGLIKRGTSRYNIWDNTNQKADNFNGGGVGSVGGWAYLYGVGNTGNVSLFGMVSRDTTSAPGNNGDDNYLGCAWHPTSEYNLYRTALGFTQANIMDMFYDYTASPRGAPALGGDYRPRLSSTRLINRVPTGMAPLRYDLAGVARKNDGTGAAGAYEAV
jgi:hypothetical protein